MSMNPLRVRQAKTLLPPAKDWPSTKEEAERMTR